MTAGARSWPTTRRRTATGTAPTTDTRCHRPTTGTKSASTRLTRPTRDTSRCSAASKSPPTHKIIKGLLPDGGSPFCCGQFAQLTQSNHRSMAFLRFTEQCGRNEGERIKPYHCRKITNCCRKIKSKKQYTNVHLGIDKTILNETRLQIISRSVAFSWKHNGRQCHSERIIRKRHSRLDRRGWRQRLLRMESDLLTISRSVAFSWKHNGRKCHSERIIRKRHSRLDRREWRQRLLRMESDLLII